MAEEKIDLGLTEPEAEIKVTDVGGISLMQKLRIPFVTSVFDEYAKSFVPVGNRLSPVGLANVQWNDIFVTSDEQAALESGTPSNASWAMGFTIDPKRGEEIKNDYPDLDYPVRITIGDSQSYFFRNFPLQDYSIQCVCGFVSFMEFDYITSRQARSLDVTNSTEALSFRTFKGKEETTDTDCDTRPIKKLQHMKAPFSLSNFKLWWTWFQENRDSNRFQLQAVLSVFKIKLILPLILQLKHMGIGDGGLRNSFTKKLSNISFLWRKILHYRRC